MIKNRFLVVIILMVVVCVKAKAETEDDNLLQSDMQGLSSSAATPLSDAPLRPGFPLPPGVPQPPGGATPLPLPGDVPPAPDLPFVPQTNAPPVFPIGVPQDSSPFGNEFVNNGVDAEQLRREMESQVLSQQGAAQTPCCQNFGGVNEDYKLQRQITNLQNYLQRQQQTIVPFPFGDSNDQQYD